MNTEVVKLADGKDWILSTLTVGDLIEVEKKFGSLQVDTAKTENVIYWVWLSLKRNHKELTLEQLYDLIDAPFLADGRFNELFLAMSRLNGWDKLGKNL